MDYLDPRKRRAYNFRLVVGYILVAIVIGLSTYLLAIAANGYGYDIKTGQVVQNGLLFTNSSPDGAQVYLNGQDKNTSTPARLILQSGNYSLTLKKNGYRDWSRSFDLNGQSVARYVYPFLFPVEPKVTKVKTYSSNPKLVTQSPDRRWLLIDATNSQSLAPTFDAYDTDTLDETEPSVERISIPSTVPTNYSVKSTLKVVEWSTSNKEVLLSHSHAGGQEFIVFDRDVPARSFNVNKLFNINPTEVSLFDKKIGQLYLFNKSKGALQLGNTGTSTLTTVISKNVLAYKPYGRNLITFVSSSNQTDGKVAARIWNNGNVYNLSEFKSGSKYLIDLAQFQGNFYYATGSNTSERINIYKNPLDSIKNPAIAKAIPSLALSIAGSQKIGFSANARFIGVENDKNFAVYDFETGDGYRYSITEKLDDNMSWMDGHRFIGNTDSKVFVMDFDGTNKQLVTDSVETFGGLFSRDFKHLLTLINASDGKGYILQDVDMRAGSDLPQQ